MGMYTEFHFNVKLKRDIAPEIIAVLEFMIGGGGKEKGPAEIPSHELFEEGEDPRWSYMLQCDSFYFYADTNSTLRREDINKSYYLCIRCNLKNYGSEIELFVDWITPYISACKGDFLGFHRYEESETPTLLHYLGEDDEGY